MENNRHSSLVVLATPTPTPLVSRRSVVGGRCELKAIWWTEPTAVSRPSHVVVDGADGCLPLFSVVVVTVPCFSIGALLTWMGERWDVGLHGGRDVGSFAGDLMEGCDHPANARS